MDLNILLVDDDQAIRKVFVRFLSMYGYKVQTAASAEEALDVLRDTSFPVMFFDIRLEGSNGLDLCKQVRPAHQTSVIYAITAYRESYSSSQFQEAGFDKIISKPIEVADLLSLIETAFQEWRAREESLGSK